MTDLNLPELRKIAEAMDGAMRLNMFERIGAWEKFKAAFDPPTVLALIDEIEKLQRWKREAKQVLKGLGDLAKVADAPLGHSIIESAIDCIAELHKKVGNLQPAKGEV